MMFHVVYRNKGNKEVSSMKQIEVKVTSVPRAGGTVLLIECSECGPVSVDATRHQLVAMAGATHLLNVHGVGVAEVRT